MESEEGDDDDDEEDGPVDPLLSSWLTRRLRRMTSTQRPGQVLGIVGDVSPKIDALVGSLLRLRRLRGPGSSRPIKSLVFSQWENALAATEQALQANDVGCVRIGATTHRVDLSEAVQKFQQNPTIEVLLLPLKRGGNGLNLVEATHVFFLEPSLEHSLVAQARKRVHRINQDKRTYVHILLTNDTVDEAAAVVAHERARTAAEAEEGQLVAGDGNREGGDSANGGGSGGSSVPRTRSALRGVSKDLAELTRSEVLRLLGGGGAGPGGVGGERGGGGSGRGGSSQGGVRAGPVTHVAVSEEEAEEDAEEDGAVGAEEEEDQDPRV